MYFSEKKNIWTQSGQYNLKGTVHRPTFENITKARNEKQEKGLSNNILMLLDCTELEQG